MSVENKKPKDLQWVKRWMRKEVRDCTAELKTTPTKKHHTEVLRTHLRARKETLEEVLDLLKTITSKQ